MQYQRLKSFGLLWLRVLMGLGIAYHGYNKIFIGGISGFAKGVASMGFPLPELFAWLAALSELAGGVCIVLGLLTPAAAFLVFSTMSVAAFVMHAADPFSDKELALCYWAMSGTLILTGGGTLSLDGLIFSRFSRKKTADF